MQVATDFNTIKKVFLGIGTVGLCSSLVMTWKFGHSISVVHGFGLAAVTLAAAFVFPARKFISDQGFKGPARWLTAAGIFCIGLEFVGDLGYTFGMRDKQVVEATAQTVAYKAVHKVADDESANLALWRKQLADLEAQNAWATTVTADGLRAQLASADKAIELETKRGGCKAKCLALMQDKAKTEEKIAVAEKVTDLTKRIEATQRILDGKTTTAVNTSVGHSTTKAQSNAFARVGLLLSGNNPTESLNPDEVSLTLADMFIGLLMAIGATALPTLCFYIAFFGHESNAFTKTTDANGNVIIHHTERVIDNEALRKWASHPSVKGLIAA